MVEDQNTPGALPDGAPILLRQRTIADLHLACMRPVVWLGGAAGSGKSALVRGYARLRHRPCLWLACAGHGIHGAHGYAKLAGALAQWCAQSGAEHLDAQAAPQDVAAAVRRLFETLLPKLPAHTLLVLDDLDPGEPDPLLATALHAAAQALPAGCNLVVTSRAPPPSAIAALQETGRATSTHPDMLVFDADDLQALAHLGGVGDLPRAVLAEWLDRSRGWAAGAALLLPTPRRERQESPLPNPVLHDYFSRELLPRLPAALLQRLLELALLPDLSPALLDSLYPGGDGAHWLEALQRDVGFIHRVDLQRYALHPLLRDDLLARGATQMTVARRRDLDSRIAAALWALDRTDDAAARWQQQDAYAEIARRLPVPFPDALDRVWRERAQRWFGCCAQAPPHPWQSCWVALQCLPGNPRAATDSLASAHAAFAEHGDTLGQACALCGLIDGVILTWGDFRPLDTWADALVLLLDSEPALPAAVQQRARLALFLARMYRQPAHQDLPALATAAQAFVETSTQPILRAQIAVHLLLYQSWWRGDLAAAQLIVDLAPDAPQLAALPLPARVAWLGAQALYAALAEPPDTAFERLHTALAAAANGPHALDGLLHGQMLWLYCVAGHSQQAADAAQAMAASLRPGRHLDHAYYHAMATLLAVHSGQPAAMLAHAHAALRCAEAAGVPWAQALVHCEAARAHAARGETATAHRHLERAAAWAQAIASPAARFAARLAALDLAAEHGLPLRDRSILPGWLQDWRRCGYINFPWARDDALAEHLARALDDGLELPFVQQRIRQRRLRPPPNRPPPAAWPLAVQVRLLGGFHLCIDGRDLAPHGKLPKKPLELLKALIASGGQAPRGQLAQALWPHLDDTAGEQVLKVTLHRLRSLIGHDCLPGGAGQVTLDSGRCSADIWALQAELSRLQRVPEPEPDCDALRTALQTLQGGICADERAAWAQVLREQLGAQALAAVHHALIALNQAERWEALAEFSRHGLGLDPEDALCTRILRLARRHLGHGQPDSTRQRTLRTRANDAPCKPASGPH